MECPKCKTINPEQNKFCYERGVILLNRYPKCGTECLPVDKFCGACGQDLSEKKVRSPRDLSADDKFARIEK